MDISIELSAYHKQVGKKLRYIRRVRKEKMVSVAKSIGLSEGTISRIERGKYPKLHTRQIMMFADYYNISIDDLISAKEIEYTDNRPPLSESKKAI